MERIEVSGVPVLIGTSGEHAAEVHASAVCRTCYHSEVQGRSCTLVCTIRLVMSQSGRLRPMEVDGNDTCDLHPDRHDDDKDADAENAESGMRT